MATIGFIGLGNMGGGMAANLAKNGHDVRAFDLSAEALDKAKKAGCLPAASAEEALAGAEAAVTMLPAGRHVERAMEIARLINGNAPLGVQVTKEAARKYVEAGEAAAIAAVATIRGRVMQSEDAAEGIRSFVERRPANFKGR